MRHLFEVRLPGRFSAKTAYEAVVVGARNARHVPGWQATRVTYQYVDQRGRHLLLLALEFAGRPDLAPLPSQLFPVLQPLLDNAEVTVQHRGVEFAPAAEAHAPVDPPGEATLTSEADDVAGADESGGPVGSGPERDASGGPRAHEPDDGGDESGGDLPGEPGGDPPA
jgi:hypothetical protein